MNNAQVRRQVDMLATNAAKLPVERKPHGSFDLTGVARAHGTEAGAVWTDADVEAGDVVDMGVVVVASRADKDGDLTGAMAANVGGVESLVAGPIAAVEIYGDENAFEKVVGSVVMLRKLSQMWLRCQRSEDAMA